MFQGSFFVIRGPLSIGIPVPKSDPDLLRTILKRFEIMRHSDDDVTVHVGSGSDELLRSVRERLEDGNDPGPLPGVGVARLDGPVVVVDPGVSPAAGDAEAEVLDRRQGRAETNVLGKVEADLVPASLPQLPGQHASRYRVAAELLALRAPSPILSGAQVEQVGVHGQHHRLVGTRGGGEIAGGAEYFYRVDVVTTEACKVVLVLPLLLVAVAGLADTATAALPGVSLHLHCVLTAAHLQADHQAGRKQQETEELLHPGPARDRNQA